MTKLQRKSDIQTTGDSMKRKRATGAIEIGKARISSTAKVRGNRSRRNNGCWETGCVKRPNRGESRRAENGDMQVTNTSGMMGCGISNTKSGGRTIEGLKIPQVRKTVSGTGHGPSIHVCNKLMIRRRRARRGRLMNVKIQGIERAERRVNRG